MSTTGLAAQSSGDNDEYAVQSHIFRAIPLGLTLGFILLLIQGLLIPLAMMIFTADAAIEASAAVYIKARLWGLPGYLGLIALMGWFIGLGKARHAFWLQLILNIINVILSLLFVINFGWGLFGVGLATAIAEWSGLLVGLILALNIIKSRGGIREGVLSRNSLLNIGELAKLGEANTNIFIRTAALTIGFSFFSNAAAGQGETFLAAHTIHLQIITLSAFILDGFANTAEATVGAAYGAKSRPRFDRAVRLTSEFSALLACLCALLIYFGGGLAIDGLTKDPAVQAMARTYLPWCALAPAVGWAAFQLDGVFIGTTRTKEMRNAGILALIVYLVLHYAMPERLGGHAIWLAFLGYYIARSLTLLLFYRNVRPAKSAK